MSALSLSLSDRFSSCLQRLPLLKPAVNEKTCAIDEKSLYKRISTVVLVALATLVASFVAPLAYPSVALALRLVSVVALATVPLNASLTERKLNQIAVAEYLDPNSEPSYEAMRRLRNHLGAAQLLVRQKRNLNRAEFTLLEGISNFDVFKCLVDHGASITQNELVQLAGKYDPRFLEHALKHGKVAVAQISNDEQVQLWLTVETRKAGELLKQHGFNPNIRDQSQATPLIRLASASGMNQYESERKIETLLQSGADRSLKNAWGKTASECAVNAEIRNLIDAWKAPTS